MTLLKVFFSSFLFITACLFCVCIGALQEYLSQVMDLEYSDTPDYTQLKAGLKNGLQQIGVALEEPLDLHIA